MQTHNNNKKKLECIASLVIMIDIKPLQRFRLFLFFNYKNKTNNLCKKT